MERYKFPALVLALILAASALTGCNVSDKLELSEAIEKSSRMTSWESSGSINYTKVTFDTNYEDLMIFQLFIPLLDGISLDVHQKVNQNSDLTKMITQTETRPSGSDISEQAAYWSHIDLNQKPQINRHIFKLPATVTASMPEDLAGKEYFVLDQSDLPDAVQTDPQEYADAVQAGRDFRVRLIELLKEHAMYKDPSFVVVNQLEDKVVNGEKLSVYRAKLDNKSLKTILRYVLSELSENELAKDIIKEMLLTSGSIAEGTEGGLDLELALDALGNGEKELKDELDIIMDALDDVKLLGSRGMEINYSVNEAGYIVNENGVFDFYIDSQEVEDAFEKISDEGYDGKEKYKFTFGLTIEFNTDYGNINQEVNIALPAISAENSFDLNDFIGAEPIFSRSVRLDFSSGSSETIFPVKLGDKTFIPLEPICRKLGFKLTTQKNGEFSLKTDKSIISGRAGSTEVAVDDKKQYLPLPVMKIENQIFVPDQFVTKCMTNGMYYNSETRELIIQKNR